MPVSGPQNGGRFCLRNLSRRAKISESFDCFRGRATKVWHTAGCSMVLQRREHLFSTPCEHLCPHMFLNSTLQKGALRALCREKDRGREIKEKERERESARDGRGLVRALKCAPERRAQGALCREKDRERETRERERERERQKERKNE